MNYLFKTHYKKDITVVLGCGGERDKSKRKKMGKIVNSLCNKIIVTDDNPRREKPKLIRKAIIKHITDTRELSQESNQSARNIELYSVSALHLPGKCVH